MGLLICLLNAVIVHLFKGQVVTANLPSNKWIT